MNVVATWSVSDNSWLFQEMYGQVFGRAAAVINFHRVQRLLVAMIRRWLLVLCSMCYDDASLQDLAAAMGRGQRYVRALFRIVGLPLAEPKQVDLNPAADFLGLTHDVTNALQTGQVVFTPRSGLLAKAVSLIQERIHEDSCTPAQASKIRGVLGFLFRYVRPDRPWWAAATVTATVFRQPPLELQSYAEASAGVPDGHYARHSTKEYSLV